MQGICIPDADLHLSLIHIYLFPAGIILQAQFPHAGLGGGCILDQPAAAKDHCALHIGGPIARLKVCLLYTSRSESSSTALRMAGMLFRCEMMKLTSISHSSCRSTRMPRPYSMARCKKSFRLSSFPRRAA